MGREEWGKESGGGIAAVSHLHLAIDKSLHQPTAAGSASVTEVRRKLVAQLYGRRRAAEADKAAVRCSNVFKIIRT